MFNNQGNSKPEASHSENGDMAKEREELVELDDVQLATIVGGERFGWTTPVVTQSIDRTFKLGIYSPVGIKFNLPAWDLQWRGFPGW